MPVTYPPIDPDAFSAFRQGDEAVFQRLFRDRFAAMTDEASAQLTDTSAATRMVETTFTRAWSERAQFDAPEKLDAFLHETLHVACVREQRRRAAIRNFETNEGVRKHAGGQRAAATADASWEHVMTAVHHKAADSSSIAGELASNSRHAAAAHVGAIGGTRTWVVPAVIVVVAIIASVIVGRVFDRMGARAAVTNALAKSDVRTVGAKAGQRGNVALNDDTQVILGPESQLRIPADFGDNLRGVKLEGTASFAVSPGQKTPFEIYAGPAAILATGDSVDVRAFPSESLVTIRSRKGSVSVTTDKSSQTLAAGQAMVVNKAGVMSAPVGSNLDEALGWVDGKLVLNNRPLREALTDLHRWFALDMYAKDTSLLRRPVTLSAGLQSSPDVIAALETAAGVKFGYEGKTMVLTDAAAVKPGKK